MRSSLSCCFVGSLLIAIVITGILYIFVLGSHIEKLLWPSANACAPLYIYAAADLRAAILLIIIVDILGGFVILLYRALK